MSILFLKLYIKLKPLISSLLWNLHHENISLRSKVIPINVLKIPVLVFCHWKILSCQIWYTVLKKILTFDTLNCGRTVFFNGGNDHNLHQSISFDRKICYVTDGEIRMMNWYLVLLFSFLGSEIKEKWNRRKQTIPFLWCLVWQTYL
jgi:hypothetical protein